MERNKKEEYIQNLINKSILPFIKSNFPGMHVPMDFEFDESMIEFSDKVWAKEKYDETIDKYKYDCGSISFGKINPKLIYETWMRDEQGDIGRIETSFDTVKFRGMEERSERISGEITPDNLPCMNGYGEHTKLTVPRYAIDGTFLSHEFGHFLDQCNTLGMLGGMYKKSDILNFKITYGNDEQIKKIFGVSKFDLSESYDSMELRCDPGEAFAEVSSLKYITDILIPQIIKDFPDKKDEYIRNIIIFEMAVMGQEKGVEERTQNIEFDRDKVVELFINPQNKEGRWSERSVFYRMSQAMGIEKFCEFYKKLDCMKWKKLFRDEEKWKDFLKSPEKYENELIDENIGLESSKGLTELVGEDFTEEDIGRMCELFCVKNKFELTDLLREEAKKRRSLSTTFKKFGKDEKVALEYEGAQNVINKKFKDNELEGIESEIKIN